MPAGGIVVVEVSPFQARSILWWLEGVEREQRTTPMGLLAEALLALRDQHDIGTLAAKFRKVVDRKRARGPFRAVEVQLARADAVWLASKVRRPGMFGRPIRSYIPADVQLLGWQCAEAVSKKRGRKRLERDRLASTLGRAHLDERHRKRLRRRQREEAARQVMISTYQGVLAHALSDAEKTT